MNSLSLEKFGFRAMRQAPPKPMRTGHHHNEIELNFIFSGGVTYLHQGITRRLEPGRMVVFWGAVPHTLVAVERGTDMAWITLPLATVRSCGMDARLVGRLIKGEWLIAPPGHGHRFPVGSWVNEMGETPGLVHELLGCLWWMAAHSSPDKGSARQSEDGLRPVAVMASFMAERYQEPLFVGVIAASAGLHPNYAMALFKKRCGVTIRDYLVQLRLMHAQRLLQDGNAKIAAVAFESGFTSLSAFYEIFGEKIQMTPTEFRDHCGGTDQNITS